MYSNERERKGLGKTLTKLNSPSLVGDKTAANRSGPGIVSRSMVGTTCIRYNRNAFLMSAERNSTATSVPTASD